MNQLLNLIIGVPTAYAQTNAAAKTGETTFDILGFVLNNLPLWITAIIVFVMSMVLGAMLKRTVENRLAAKITEEHQELLIISGRLTFVGMVIIGGTISLAIAGINVTNLIAAIGFGISFGLQDTIANFVAGIALLASRPFTIGDWIKVDGMMGKVTEIRVRATYLNTFDGLRLIVPNSQLYKSQVLSYTSNPMRRLKVPAYIRYYADMKQVYAICLNVLKARTDILLEPKPHVVVTELGDYYIELEIRFWVDSKSMWRRIQSQVYIEIENKLEEAGLEAPYPTTALEFDPDDKGTLVRTKILSPAEMEQIMKERQEDAQQYAKRREELAAPLFKAMEEQKNIDQSGMTFLKATAGQAPTLSQQMEQAPFPPNSPQSGMQQDSQKAAEQAMKQVGTPTAFAPNIFTQKSQPESQPATKEQMTENVPVPSGEPAAAEPVKAEQTPAQNQ